MTAQKQNTQAISPWDVFRYVPINRLSAPPQCHPPAVQSGDCIDLRHPMVTAMWGAVEEEMLAGPQ